MKPRLRLLSDEMIGRILEEAFHLLETRGINLHHEGLLGRLGDLGCRTDRTKEWVWLPRELVERCIRSCPHEVQLWNIAGTRCCGLSGDKVHFTPGSTAIKVLDSETQSMRPATAADMVAYGKLVEQLDAIDYSATAITPSDVPKEIGDSIRLYALVKTTSKPICTGAFTIPGFDVMTELQLAVRGTREALREKPFAFFSACPTSPFKWSRVTADNTMKAAELGVPIEFIAMPLAGLVAPISVLGCVIQHTVETLSGIVLSQATCPGAPILYGGSPGVFDMRSMAASICAVEAQMMDCAYAEVGKHLGLPTQAYIGMSDSKALDAQAGFESGTGYYLAALAGINSVSGPGMHYFESCQSPEKTVFDAEACRLARRLAAGIGVRNDFPSDPIFDELLREQNLLTAEHTLKHFRAEHCVPGPVIDRTQLSGPSTTLWERAHAEVARHLAAYRPPDVLSPEQLREVERVMRSAAGGFPLPL
ncbi:MAG: hypothetical protein FJ290_12750 [Planctomycetes bacterium]|nr:hypothetical protein [Planctomycetota bacterium]